jgi:polyisoprenyl-phosphate glycosyltransferase
VTINNVKYELEDKLTLENFELAIVVPVFNESDSLPLFWERLSTVLDSMDTSHQVIFINDGSTDNSLEVLTELTGHNIKLVNLIINSGHMAALDAGFRKTNANWVLSMDADLQHPPEAIPEMLKVGIGNKVDVVYAVRSSRAEESFQKRFTASLYYKILRNLSGVRIYDNAADFRLFSNRVLLIIQELEPRSHVFRLLIPKLGFPSATYEYVAASRVAGESKYGFPAMVRLAMSSLVSFSVRPLILSVYLGLIFSLLSVFGLTYSFFMFANGQTIPGWASLSSLLFLLFGILFILLGIIGAYLAEVWKRTSGIPDYFVGDVNFFPNREMDVT